jgi:hypothetical protein
MVHGMSRLNKINQSKYLFIDHARVLTYHYQLDLR